MIEKANAVEGEFKPVRGLGAIDPDRAGADAAQDVARWVILGKGDQLIEEDHPELRNVSVNRRFGYLVLTAPGMLRLDIPMDVLEDDPSVIETVMIDGVATSVVDEGAWAQEWFTQVLGQPARLVKRI